MKKLATAGLLAAALALTALSGQKAAAWGCDSCGVGCGNSCGGCCSHGGCWGFGLSFNFTRCGCSTPCWNACSFCQPCSCPPACICADTFAGYGGYAAADYGYPAAGYPAAPTADIQTVGYGYQAGYGYTGYAAPSYWYGR